MSSPSFDAVAQAVREARETEKMVQRFADELAELIDGKLQSVSEYRLRRLKNQLRNFNAVTGRWK